MFLRLFNQFVELLCRTDQLIELILSDLNLRQDTVLLGRRVFDKLISWGSSTSNYFRY